MATLVQVEGCRGGIVHTVKTEIILPRGYVLPNGHLLSWQETFRGGKDTVKGIFNVGSAKVRIKSSTTNETFIEVRIESPSVRDMEEAIQEVILFMGGQGGPFCLRAHKHSFVLGLIGDAYTLINFLRAWYRIILWKLF